MKRNAVILIPSYEPDDLLVDTVKNIHAEGFDILVINDGSSNKFDDTFNQVKDIVTYLQNDKNRGKGYTLKRGFREIPNLFPEAKYVITVDGDGQHLLKDILRVYDELETTNEIVLGTRHFRKGTPFKSLFGNNLSKINRSLLTKQYVADDQCGLRGFPVRYLDELSKIRGNRYEYEMNQVVQFQLKQYVIRPIIIEAVYLDNNSRSHFSPLKDTLKIQGIILSHSILSILCLLGTIACVLLGLHFLNLPSILIVYGSYTAMLLLYIGLISIFYPTKMFLRRIRIEALFTAIRMLFAHLIIFAFYDILKLSFFVIAPIAILLATSLNVLLTWAFRKTFLIK